MIGGKLKPCVGLQKPIKASLGSLMFLRVLSLLISITSDSISLFSAISLIQCETFLALPVPEK